MKLVFFGTPQFAVPSLGRLLAEPDMEVLAVVTQPDKRRGRGNALSASPVKAMAERHGLQIWQPARIKKDVLTLESLRLLHADAFVVVAYGQILSSEILAMPRLGCINAHGSLLPDYRGAAPIQWSLVHGHKETGITTMLMDEGMDTGAMLLKGSTPIGLMDTAVDVAEALALQAGKLLLETLRGLDNETLTPIPQDDAIATYAPLIKKADYNLDFGQSAIALHNQIRGFYPNCVATFQAQPLKVLGTAPLGVVDDQLPEELQAQASVWQAIDADAPPGTVVGLLKNWGAIVQTGEGLLLLREVKPAGKRAQSGWDFVNGNRLQVGDPISNGEA